MSAMDFYLKVVKALDEIGAPYMLVGAFAGYVYGMTRTTFDIDILVDLGEEHFDALSARFPLPRYYADPVMMRNSTRMGIMFNLIDTQEGVKADLVPVIREPGYRQAFEHRVRKTFKDAEGATFDAWCARPADIIIGKLKAWTEGRSAKHPQDIYNILAFSFIGLSEEQIDLDEVAIEAEQIGDETLSLWQELIARARREVKAQDDSDQPTF